MTQTPEVLEAVRDRRTNFYIRLGGTNRNAEISAAFERGQSASYGWLYTTRPAVRTVVDYIARNLAQLPMKLFERIDDDEREEDRDHPAAELMRYPDWETPFNQFIFRWTCDWLIYDNAYLVKFRPPDSNGALMLVRVPPYLVTVSGGRFRADLYRIWRYDGTFIERQPSEIIHWKGYNPDDALLGVSKLETLRDTLAEDLASQTATVELMKSGLKGGHIERPLEAPEWSDEALRRFQEDWANQRTRSPRLDPVLEEGMKWVPTAMSPKDAELLSGRRFTVEEVSRIYGLHPRLLGLSESGSSTEIEDLRRQFYTDTLPPITQPLAAQFDTDILRAEYDADDYYFEFNLNEKLRGDPDKRFQAITAAVGRPWMLVDEARALENRAPVEGGDELTIPLNVALGSLPAPNVMPPQNALKPPQDGSHRDGSEDEEAAGELETKEPEEPRQLPQTASTEPPPRYAERALRALFERFFGRQAKALHGGRAFNAERWNRELGNDLYSLLREVVARESGTSYDVREPDDPGLKHVADGAAEGINDYVRVQLDEHPAPKAFERIRERYEKVASQLASRAVELSVQRKTAAYGSTLMSMLPREEHPVLADPGRLERLRGLRDLGLPDEVIWELAGFSEDEINRMHRLTHARSLLAATSGDAEPPLASDSSIPSDH